MAAKAIRDGYPIDGELRARVVATATAIADKSPSERTRLAACKLLITADALNERREAAERDAGRPAVVNIDARVQLLLQQLQQMPVQAPPAEPRVALPSR